MKPSQQTKFIKLFEDIIRRTSCELPKDIVQRIEAGSRNEDLGTNASYAMNIIRKNIELARSKQQPICQDTGSILFFIHYPKGVDAELLGKVIRKAVVNCTKKGYLRQNSVDSLTGKNSGTNVGPGSPSLHFVSWSKSHYDIRLILKGGGCENMGVQYSLPDSKLQAGRDLAGVRKCILDAVHRAQGKGCGPGILGVTIGGDRATGYLASKEQLLRKLDDKNREPKLAELEATCLRDGNALGIGPMGFGGQTTLLGVKVGALNRLPASYFVSVSYMCWAFRRQGALVSSAGQIKKWLY